MAFPTRESVVRILVSASAPLLEGLRGVILLRVLQGPPLKVPSALGTVSTRLRSCPVSFHVSKRTGTLKPEDVPPSLTLPAPEPFGDNHLQPPRSVPLPLPNSSPSASWVDWGLEISSEAAPSTHTEGEGTLDGPGNFAPPRVQREKEPGRARARRGQGRSDCRREGGAGRAREG